MNTKTRTRLTAVILGALLAVSGCGRGSNDDKPAYNEPAVEETQQAPVADLASLLASESRAEADRARDEGRKPAEVIAFLGIEPGMKVIDIIAASGFYTEVLSLAVGPEGHVTSHNPPFVLQMRDGINEKGLSERLAGNRLPNVSRLNKDIAELTTDDGSFDAAFTALNLHDIYNRGGDEAGIGAMKIIYAMLKPGGVFGVIDHDGAAGNDNNELHRMQKADALRLATAAGFIVDGDSGLLHNHNDDMTQQVFAEGMRGNTNRFLLKLRKLSE